MISNNSGRLGAALTRPVGEDLPTMRQVFPHWFAPNFLERVRTGAAHPVDQHQLLACIAPRPLYVASASADLHADPEGEFTSWRMAAAAWSGQDDPPRSGGQAGATSVPFPHPGQARAIPGLPLGYHLRDGEHSDQPLDWQHWLAFRDRLHERAAPR